MIPKQDKLKPLNHKKPTNNIDPILKSPFTKGLLKDEAKKSTTEFVKPAKKSPTKEVKPAKPVKLERTAACSTKTIEHYDCDDFEL
jgi:hypothetical protein